MLKGTSFFEDRETEIDGFTYIFSGRVDYAYSRNGTSEFCDLELVSVEIDSVIKLDEDSEVCVTDEEKQMIKDLVEEQYDEYIDECESD